MSELPRQSWLEAEPRRAALEQELVPQAAPRLTQLLGGGWQGELPVWPFDRPEPPGLQGFLAGAVFTVRIEYLESFPMTPPKFWPLDPEPEVVVRSMARWHVNPDGSLCMFQAASDWDPTASAADLVAKAAGWFLEFLLLQAGLIAAMTEAGIAENDELDHLFSGPGAGL